MTKNKRKHKRNLATASQQISSQSKVPQPKQASLSQNKEGFWQSPLIGRISTISLGTLIALFVAYQGYINAGADSLRNDIYQPLYREVDSMRQSLNAANVAPYFSSQAFDSLKQSGNLGRIPQPLQEKIVDLYLAAGKVRGHILPVAHEISVLMPPAIEKIRTEADHKTWIDKTLIHLNANSDSNSGSFPLTSFTFQHAGVSPMVDVRDLSHLKIAAPGIITWQVNDWIKFPLSATDVAALWPDTCSLDFDQNDEQWYYIITKDDLTRNKLNLQGFLKPIFDQLVADPEFKRLVEDDKFAFDQLDQVEPLIARRVAQPKQLTDLW